MKILITGGAGFIGRWVVKKYLDEGHKVIALDNLRNSHLNNIQDFQENKNFEHIQESILNKEVLNKIFNEGIDLCIHLAAEINVQESIDNPKKHFETNIIGTQNLLDLCLKDKTKIVVVSTCMVYDTSSNYNQGINENHPLKPASPYAGTKSAAEFMALSYYHAYKLPVVVLRPFNTYGPFQKNNMEGGVVSIFITKNLKKEYLNIFGDGTQTRDLLYVEDCAEFIFLSAENEASVGKILNAGSGKDVSINDLALMITKDKSKIKNVKHHHPQAEIAKLLCDNSKSKNILNWEPKHKLEEGIKKTQEWIKLNGLR